MTTTPRTLSIVTLLLIVLAAVPLQAQEAMPSRSETETPEIEEIRREIQQLRVGQQAIRRQLAEIQRLLEEGGEGGDDDSPRDVVLDLAGLPALGEANAPITLVEFSDFQCPYCARHASQTLPQLEENFINTGKLRYVASDYPLPNHAQAPKAAEAAHCAQEQGRFWEASRKFFENYSELEEEKLHEYAAEIGLDTEKFTECLASHRHAEAVAANKSAGAKAGVAATPTFLLGYTQPGGEFRATAQIRGAHPYETFVQEIEQLLSELPSVPEKVERPAQ